MAPYSKCSAMVFLVCVSMALMTMSEQDALRVGFYQWNCPSAEAIVRRVVNNFVSQNPGLGAGLIRLHFHDCFVRGCDASILLDSTPGNPSEKESPPNKGTLRGFQVIDQIKSELESACPQTVSCSDILAFAARDSTLKLGDIYYAVPSGRRDGLVSRQNEPLVHLPSPTSNLDQLQTKFSTKGLSLGDMVTLSGAHSIGVSHCSSFSTRLVNPQENSLDLGFASLLKAQCPNNGVNSIVPLEFETPNRLDNKYYRDLIRSRGLLASDQALMSSPSSAYMVNVHATNNMVWAREFAGAMTRMGLIEVMTGRQGQIRRNCRVLNY
ncbi:hypothetical protein V2J09_000651 [Rumex salicifolius]